MKALTIEAPGVLAVREHPTPVPGVGEVLVRIRAAGLNPADLGQRAGLYPAPSGSPADIPGLELAGEVAEVGPLAQRFAVGDRVMAVVGGGAQAEYLAVHERQLMPVPESVDWAAAGGFPEAFVTAHDALHSQAGLRPGERVLVNGAAGGVGVAAVQIAAAAGAEVIASVRNPDNHEPVTALGATAAVEPADAPDHGPYDVILELVGGDNLGADLRSLNGRGRIVVIGVGSGREATLDLGLLALKRATVRASVLRTRPLEDKANASRAVEREVLPFLASGEITVPVAATHPLDDASAAYDRLSARGKLGKVVLLV
ncbi:zinc-binding dehydrogenase [Pseudonocardia sp. WMMC193]|uniref:zinc-binding dehydrogenase n=1 Tax=Pseudonocardia sp. WMMC193 TaxID=2911965 RepID=UPI001F3F002D|nr:zinc-binding dehydrogenase [Pseudonocardia sp. WMMC193]MCF7550639.1 zinc-binding dehydrogenase [Pseudonocardia sp. WMMC193]